MVILLSSPSQLDALASCTGGEGRVSCVQKGELLRLEGVWFYHRVSQGVPFYHSSVVEKLLTVGLHHRSRKLPG